MTSTTIKPSTSRKVKCLIRNSEPTQPQTMTRPTPKLTYGPPYFSNKFIGREYYRQSIRSPGEVTDFAGIKPSMSDSAI
jgi:hypothetical protein